MPNEIIQYTGNFKTMQDVADWINNFEQSDGVEVTQILTRGTSIATIKVGQTPTTLYAPPAVEVEQILQEGVEIAAITIGSNILGLYAPEQTVVRVTAIQHSGKHIADISINGVTTELYAPNGGGGGSTFFTEDTYTDINGNTVTALYQIPEVQVGSSDSFFYMDEYTDINGNTVNALYQS